LVYFLPMEVNLTKRVSTPEGLRYLPVVVSANGRIKPDWVLLDGRAECHPEGAYYLEWREDGKRRRLSVGKNAADAQAQRLRKQAELNARAQGVKIAPDAPDADKRSLAAAISAYLEETRLTKKPKTFQAYSKSLKYFEESCPKLFLEDIERIDMVKFAAFLRDDKEQAPRSAWNKFNNTMGFLKAQGLPRGFVKAGDWPKFVQSEPEVYEQEELNALYAVCDAEERLWWDFFRMTGMREQEVMYTFWTDVNFIHATVTVRWKPKYGWTPKAYKEREIPIPQRLVADLKKWRSKAKPGCPFLFPTAGCKPKLDFLDCLKACAKRGGLNPEDFFLHKFRATFATLALTNGIDLRTVQQYLGHVDLESTMRYLKPSRSQATKARMNEIFG
jgi:integrase/recombinase XerD